MKSNTARKIVKLDHIYPYAITVIVLAVYLATMPTSLSWGYKNFGIHPLLVDIKGKPFVDVRKSLNSFLPKGLRKNEYNS